MELTFIHRQINNVSIYKTVMAGYKGEMRDCRMSKEAKAEAF
jgi:hypothetical protein